MTFEGKENDVGWLLDALEEGNGDGESLASDDAAKGSRKTPHCLPRLVNTMVGDVFRPRMIESEAQASRAELDNGAVGVKQRVWVDLKKAILDPKAKVRGITRGWCVCVCGGRGGGRGGRNGIHLQNHCQHQCGKMAL